MDNEKKPVVTPDDVEKKWYIIKVQSNREESISERLRKQAVIEGLDGFFGRIVVPFEKVTELRHGKKYVVKRKLYPGYIIVEMSITDDTWFLVREIPGIGDFAGSAGKAIAMQDAEVQRILSMEKDQQVETPTLNIPFMEGEKVKIKDGTFVNFEGVVDRIDQKKGLVTVLINTMGRTMPIEVEYLQIEKID